MPPSPDTPSPPATITRLQRADAQAYRTLMLPAYADHAEAFTTTAAERAAQPLAWWQARLDEDWVLAARVAGELAGAVVLAREPREKLRHKASLVAMYVQPAQRGRGLGQALVEAALATARTVPGLRLVQLTVTDGNRAAQALYQRCGFRPWGLEPMAMAQDGRLLAKQHLWCPLDPADAA